MTTLASLADFATFRGVILDLDDAHALQALEGASDAIRGYTGQAFERVSEDVLLDGSGTPGLLLPQMPVISVDYVASLDREDVETEIADYTLDRAGIIWRKGFGCWPLGHQNITISYVHGYATIPGDVRDACLELAGLNLTLSAGRVVSLEQIGTYQVQYSDSRTSVDELSGRDVLDRYRLVTHP